MSWLESNAEEEKETYETKQKEVEEAVRDVLLFLQVNDDPRVKEARAASAAKDTSSSTDADAEAPGPKIEEVD